MADRLRLAVFRQRLVVHALEIIVGRVVLAHVVLAEVEVLALVIAPLGRLEDALGLATGMAAGRFAGTFSGARPADFTRMRSNRREFKSMI